MKKLYILLIVAISCTHISFAQDLPPSEMGITFNCGTEETQSFYAPGMATSSENGWEFTPKGDLRALVVYVDWDFDDFGDIPGYNLDNVTQYELGEWGFGDPFPDNHIDSNGDVIWANQNFSEFSPLSNPASDANENVSEFFYHMSDGKFRMYFETLKDGNGNATNVVIDPVNYTTQQFMTRDQINDAVFAKISNDYPQDWTRFDIRPDMPFWNKDASETLNCLETDPPSCNDNKVLDYLIIIYRNSEHIWEDRAPIQSHYTAVSEHNKIQILDNGYTTAPRVSWFNFYGGKQNLVKVMIHEISHGYYYAPHYAGANDVHGRYFHSNYLSNNMSGMGILASTSNAWERWFSGWTEITHDVDNSIIAPTAYNLKGFLEDNESMRVKLPYTQSQYIWLENRVSTTNPFYDILTYKLDSNGNTIPKQGPGLYAYVEQVAESRSATHNIYFDGRNGLKMINGCGNFDYVFDEFYQAPYYWTGSPEVMKVDNFGANAYNGQHTASLFRSDFPLENGLINYSSGSGNEVREVMEVDNLVVWGERAPYVQLPMQKLSAFTNPPLSNFQEIDVTLRTLSPMVLHSLSITPSQMGTSMNITVNYEDGHIEDDFRMTGNVYLPGGETIILNHSKELLLNRTKSPTTFRIRDDGSFSDPTVFIAADNSSFSAINNSTIILDEGTTMIYESGSTLNMQSTAKLYVRNGSLLCLKSGSNINLSPGAQIIVEDGSIEIGLGVNISGNVVYTSDYIAPVQHFTTLDWCGPTSNPEHKHSTLGTYIDTANCGVLSINLAPTDVVKLTSETEIEITGVLNVPAGAYFETDILYWADDCDKTFFFGTNGVPIPFTGSGGDEEQFEQKDKPPFEVAILPNPSNGNFEVQIDKTLASFTYTLYDFSGNVVLEDTKHNTDLFSVSQSGLLPGIYILEVVSNNDVVSVKVVVNK